MKKGKGDLAEKQVTAVKRKAETAEAGILKVKKKKQQRVENTSPTSPENISNKKSKTNGNTTNISKSPIKPNGGFKIKKKATLTPSDAAERVFASNELKKKKKKKNKLKKLQQSDVSGTSSTFERPEGTVNADGIKKKKKKNKKKSRENGLTVVKQNVSSDKLSEERSTDTASPNKIKKKKNKNKLHQGSQHTVPSPEESGISPAASENSLKKKTKKKLRNKTEKQGSSESLRASVKANKTQDQDQAKPGSPKESKKNKKPPQITKLGKVAGAAINNGQSPLKGKALKRHINDITKTISRLKEFKTIQATLILKTSSKEKKKKIQDKIKTIHKKLKKFEAELSALQGQNNSVVIVNKKVFVGLPEEEPVAKKKNKQVDLKEFLQNQMKSSRFRWLNENLYTSSSGEAQEFFKEDPASFKAYHEGYAEQVSKWPVNPVDIIISELKSLPKGSVVADLGCGEAKIAAALPNLKVHSLDFIALKPEVIACDMAHCPLLRSSVDVAVFCLSLMGTNVSDFLLEANRILKTGGTMEVAEVESRFDNIDKFAENVEKYGFKLKKKDSTDMFVFLTFTKTKDVNKSGKLPDLGLKACVYKKR